MTANPTARDAARTWFRRKLQAVVGSVGVRGLERRMKASVSKATISRVNRGWTQMDLQTARLLGKEIGVCPCCDQDWKRHAQ